MATEWTSTTLGEFVTLQRGHDLPDQRRRTGTVPVIGSFGITGWHDEARATGPGVAVGRSGASFGVVTYSNVDFWPLNTALYVKDFHGNDPRFAYFFLKAFDFSAFNSGSAQPSLNRNYIHPVPISVPQLAEQRRIAHILGTLDDKIELNRRINETLEAMARALFKSWFVDFDPVRAKAQGRDPGLPPHLADLFPSRLVDSPLGPIPEGWDVRPVSDMVTDHRDGVNPMDAPEDEFEHFSIPAFDDGRGPRVERGATILSLKLIVGNDAILVSKLNPEIPRVWWADAGRGDRSVASTEFLVLRPRPGYGRAFVYCVATSAAFREQIESLVTGTSKSHQRAGRDSVLSLPIVVAPKAVLSTFESLSSPWLERVAVGRQEIAHFGELRDALLAPLVGGMTS